MNAQFTPASAATVEPETIAVTATVVEQSEGVGLQAGAEHSPGEPSPDLQRKAEIEGKRVFYDDREVYGM